MKKRLAALNKMLTLSIIVVALAYFLSGGLCSPLIFFLLAMAKVLATPFNLREEVLTGGGGRGGSEGFPGLGGGDL